MLHVHGLTLTSALTYTISVQLLQVAKFYHFIRVIIISKGGGDLYWKKVKSKTQSSKKKKKISRGELFLCYDGPISMRRHLC